MFPVYSVLGAGLAGRKTTVSSPATLGSPSEVTSCAFVRVVEPIVVASAAVQVLRASSAVNGPGPTSRTELELVTEPAGPVVPWVLTFSGPDVKSTAGPYCARPEGADAVTGTGEPPGGSVTVGVGPRVLEGLPNRLTSVKKP
jgi:hypothetical protein